MTNENQGCHDGQGMQPIRCRRREFMFPETVLMSGTVSDTGLVQSITMQQMRFISIFNEGLMICLDIITNSQRKIIFIGPECSKVMT